MAPVVPGACWQSSVSVCRFGASCPTYPQNLRPHLISTTMPLSDRLAIPVVSFMRCSCDFYPWHRQQSGGHRNTASLRDCGSGEYSFSVQASLPSAVNPSMALSNLGLSSPQKWHCPTRLFARVTHPPLPTDEVSPASSATSVD